MLSLSGRNVNEVFRVAMMHFRQTSELITLTARGGEHRLVYPTPISSMYHSPRERVLFDANRDCNPFFHFMESLWIIGGRNDVAWLQQWLKAIDRFSDNGTTFHGAYGARLRKGGQFEDVMHRLATEENTTRAVLEIYDADIDSGYQGKDMPCNCTIFLGVHDNKLNMTVANRSNDMIWGAYGANVVQFSMLQEYMAGHLGCDVGWYIQMSNNAHLYPDHEVTERCLSFNNGITDHYSGTDFDELPVRPFPFGMHDPSAWDRDLKNFLMVNEFHGPYKTMFFQEVAQPMRVAHAHYKSGALREAIDTTARIAALDWRIACREWLERRLTKRGQQ